ncbi:MAG: hypothetical protein PHN88_09840 [Ignavibacteria bacterium]|nr:hypothetical protein [Ignavibacteria bacterium]
MDPVRRKVILFYLLLLLFHAAHILEEVWAKFWPVGRYYSMETFILLNWILFALPIACFYFYLLDKKWAYYTGLIYAFIMILNGLGHNIATIVTGKYFGGFAGGFSGIGLILSGIPLFCYLRKEKIETIKQKTN